MWPWVLLAVVVLFFGGCGVLILAVGSSVNSNHHATDATTANVGQEVRDGKFAFVVKNVRTSKQEGLSTARGEFVILTMTVTNIGQQPQSFFVQNQKLVDTAGKEYAADSMAALEMNRSENGDNNSMLTDMNPGFTVTVLVPFDVPPGTTFKAVELHDSVFSDGAKVKL
ncbi:hypothetical protein AWC13_09900 [Mycobacterium kubicae]|nr:hypothetical protein AWC13_09900 [Mycobacterium kubicae]